MSFSSLVRTSRDGDQFHYLWAARRCLRLLSPSSGLVAVSIEGVSPKEDQSNPPIDDGEQLIDVAEYYRGEDWESAQEIRYIQLKHSTLRADENWTWSTLKKTLAGFAQRFKALTGQLGTAATIEKTTFCFVSNRPVASEVTETIEDLAKAKVGRHPRDVAKLRRATGLKGADLLEFCRLLRIEGSIDGCWDQRNILTQEASGYLADADFDAPMRLKELVTRKATSEGQANPVIRKQDVLRALNTDEHDLFPAKCLIERAENAVPREQEAELVGRIVEANHGPIIIHAAGGVGKSIFSTRIGMHLPPGSCCVLYDCFGNGQYRSSTGLRHRHKDALTQIANELASRGLCHPLIPTPKADGPAYVSAFLRRLKQGITSLKAENPDALLCIVVDAADNAQIAAEEMGERRSFVLDLLRERMPDDARLVALCRSHRVPDHPPDALVLELKPFSRAETAKHVRHSFPDATEHDVDEFHRLTSNNPRVQSRVLAGAQSLTEVLRKLGPNPTTVDETISNLLEHAINKLVDAAALHERSQINKICEGLAVLRPLIPIPVLADMAGVDKEAVRSFALDLGRPLLVTGEFVQFFDEPAETWFRDHFRPNANAMKAFVEALRPLALRSTYVASAIPQLMLDAGQLTELVSLALSTEGLPDESPVDRRDVELQRLQFALKASLRAKRYADAAKLALRAGGESAGNARQEALLQANTDLAAVFLGIEGIQEIVARRTFGSSWRGSHHAYDSAVMSEREELIPEARSRLRMAEEWLSNWNRLSAEEREEEEVHSQDVCAMALAHLNVCGAARSARSLRRWRPRSFSFEADRLLAEKLVDHGRFDDLDALALAAGNDLYLILAIAVELRRVQRNPPTAAVSTALALSMDSRVVVEIPTMGGTKCTSLNAITALVEAAQTLGLSSPANLSSLLARYCPESPGSGDYSRFSSSRADLLRAESLRASLENRSLTILDLAHAELRKELEAKRDGARDAREFKRDIGALLPWYMLRADVVVGHVSSDNLSERIATAEAAGVGLASYGEWEEMRVVNEIALVRFEVLTLVGLTTGPQMGPWTKWLDALPQPLYTTTLTQLARRAARTEPLQRESLEYANRSFEIIKDDKIDAAEKASAFVDLARAVLPVGKSHAEAYFNEAVAVASKIGDENLDRWWAMTELAQRSGDELQPNPEAAYKFARCAEVTYAYVDRDKHFDWCSSVRAIAHLCPCSSFAILSRWRDRGFGWQKRLLPIVVNCLVEETRIDPKDAFVLLGFRAHWNEVELLETALATCHAAEKGLLAKFAFRYIALEGKSPRAWRALSGVLQSHGVVITELQEASASSGSAESHGDSASITIPVGDFDNGEATEQGWRPVFEGVDIATPDGIHDAYARFMTFEAPRYHRRFFREACNRVPAGQEPEFMRAFASVQEFSLYQYRDFLEAIPQGWLEFPAIRRTLARLVKDIGSRFCLELANSNYDPFPFDLAARVAGLTESEIADVVLAALGESSEMFGAQRLFSLVSLLTLRLSSIGALEALAFGFSLFEAVTEVDDGDGPWSKALEPPSDIRAALAGYIWGGLASPRGAIRWEAAHVARAACELDRASLLARLIELMTSTTGGPFADSRLHFYGMHARQWLMIALARAAKANPRALLPHVDNLLMLACTSNPHVVIRKFAAEAVLAVIDSGLLGPRGQQLLLELTTLDVSPFPVVESGRYSRVSAKSDPNDNEQQLERFYFDMDFGPNWLRPLGDCFALSQRAVESIVTDVILHDWQWPSIDGRIEDQRIRQGVFRNGEHYASRASNPKTHGEHKYSWGLCRSGFWDVRVDRPESWEPVAERVCQGVV